MRKIVLTGICGLAALLFACGDEGAAPDVETGDCSLEVLSPPAGSVIQAGEPVDIRWRGERTGGRVAVELLRDGMLTGPIRADTADDGYTYWYGDLLGGDSGSGYAVRVRSLAEDGCVAVGDEFSLFDTQGCDLMWTLADSHFITGESALLEWTSNHATDLVDIELITWEGTQGVIAEAVENDGRHVWDISSFHGGTSEFYRLLIRDHANEACADTTDHVFVFDPDCCRFYFFSPDTYSDWRVGDTRTITFWSQNTSGRVSIHLFAGTIYVGLIANNVSTEAGSYEWEVHRFQFDGPDHLFRVVVRDMEDEYCIGRSEIFEIHP